MFAFLAFAAGEAHADALFPPPLYPDASNAAQPAAAQNFGIGLGSALAPGATALVGGGSGYALGDTLTLACTGCTFTTSPIVAVTSINSGAINGWVVTRPGVATRLPANVPAPALTQSATSGSGAGASFTGAFAPLAAGLSVAALSNTGGNATNANLFITAESPDPGIYGAENLFVGDRAGQHLTGGSTANTAIGVGTCGGPGAPGTFLGNFNTCLGDGAGRNMYRAGGLALQGITAIGQNALRNVNGTGGFSTALGISAGSSVTTGNNNLTLGPQVASTTLTTGANNVVIGTSASCDTANPGDSSTIHLCAGAGDVLTVTGAGTPATSVMTVAGNLPVGGAITGASTLARSFRSPSNPAGTNSLTGVMMGLAGAITPTVTGKLRFTVTGSGNNNTAGDGWIVQLRYGTGAAPANGGALTGTICGQTKKTVVGTSTTMFIADCYATGLTVNTAYWFDLMLEAVTGGTATLFFIDMVGIEES